MPLHEWPRPRSCGSIHRHARHLRKCSRRCQCEAMSALRMIVCTAPADTRMRCHASRVRTK
eukprot:10537270-Alexandrium_andersonii.AAC.1